MCVCVYVCVCARIRQVCKGFANDPGDDVNPWSSHAKDSKMVLGATLLNSQHFKIRINGCVE